MRFHLVDRIDEVTKGRSIAAVKYLTLGEEYLADHFPTFPVMPGVLMLQTLVEAGAWLLRATDDFQYSLVMLREAKNVKYGHFMEPGRSMRVRVEMLGDNGGTAEFKGNGEMDGHQTVSARFTLGRGNVRDRVAGGKAIDDRLIADWRERFSLLRHASSLGA
jgi:3-hydroxyacyl-[acyl-carrier-protein] dehydratase